MKNCCAVLVFLLISACVQTPKKNQDEGAIKAYTALAKEYMAEQMSTRAVRSLQEVIQLDQQNAEAWMLLGEINRRNGDIELAQEAYEKAVKYDSGSPVVANNYGTFLFQKKKYAKALDYFLQAGSNTSYLKRAIAYQNAGLSALKLERKDDAIKYFKRAVQLNSSLITANFELAKRLYQDGNFVLARHYYKQYVSYARQTPESLCLGIGLAQIFNNPDDKASYRLQLRKLYPKSQDICLSQKSLDHGSTNHKN